MKKHTLATTAGGTLLASLLLAAAACESETPTGNRTTLSSTEGFDASAESSVTPMPAVEKDSGSPDGVAPLPAVAAVEHEFFVDFESTLPPQIDPGAGTLTATGGYALLGTAGNTFGASFLRSPTASVVKVTLTDLPAHTALSIAFLFAAIDSLDGTGTYPAGDFFRVTLDGAAVFRHSFANAEASQIQDWLAPEGSVLARRTDLGFQGPGGYYTDSAYDMSLEPSFQKIPHTASSAVIEFTIEGEGVQTLDDESWAIDNVRITTK